MTEFLRLPQSEQHEIIYTVSSRTGLSLQAVEKDIWLCWVLNELFKTQSSIRLAFKGGTSLSKVFGAIQRFSEDVDVTLDFMDLFPTSGVDPFDPALSKGALKRYSDQLKEALRKHVQEVIAPRLSAALHSITSSGGMLTVNDEGDLLKLQFPTALKSDQGFRGNWILVEFGGRNTTLPSGPHRIEAIAASYIADVKFPVADVTTLAPERTFWEKATLIHVECNRQRPTTPERLSRHWYDLYMLAGNEIGRSAMADRALLEDVVKVKKVFFNASYAHYDACLEYRFQLVPSAALLTQLENDYLAMIASGMFTAPPSEFREIMARLKQLEDSINRS